MGRYTSGGVGRDVLAGAVAGGAAVWLISKMDWSLSHAGARSPGTTGRTTGSTSGNGSGSTDAHPAQAAASRAADAAGVRLTEGQTAVAGHTVHYGVGIAVGALYGLLRGMAPAVSTGRGSLFGLGTFIVGDEIGTPALGLAKGPMEYSARDHGRSALAHVVFGLATDLGTRLLSPWKSEVVILRGPTLGERVDEGRQALADGRDYLQERGQTYLDQGRKLAGEYAELARDRYDELDVPGRVKRGRKRAQSYADDIASRLSDRDDLADAVDQGRDRVRGWARDLGGRLPDRDDLEDGVETGRKRLRGWLGNAADRLPDRDDVEDALKAGRKRARGAAKRARERLPDRDEVDAAVEAGRKRVERLAGDARDAGTSGFDRFTRWLFG